MRQIKIIFIAQLPLNNGVTATSQRREKFPIAQKSRERKLTEKSIFLLDFPSDHHREYDCW
jgi:hypothetical protein